MRLADCFSEIFSYVLYLVKSPPRGLDAATARATIAGLFDQASRQGGREGFPPEAVRSAAFGVCAFVDETILCSTWEGREAWARSQLQQTMFGTANAGVEFFDRLEALPPDDGIREVYALCLVLGFRGAYFFAHQEAALFGVRKKILRQLLGSEASEYTLADIPLFPEAIPAPAQKTQNFSRFWKREWALTLIPILAAVIAAQVYMFARSDLNALLLGFFGSIG